MGIGRQGLARPPLETPLRAEGVAGRPILHLGAALWDADRYEAFRICYQAMRRVDDLVDSRRSRPTHISPAEKDAIAREVRRWMLDGGGSGDACLARLQEVRKRFKIPRWTWERWTRSMLYDLDHDGFAGFSDYLRYSEGAAVAPGAIFMHLCGVRRIENEYHPPLFDIRWPARPLAIFCYLVHVVRDFEADQRNNLNYFPARVLARHDLVPEDLRKVAEDGPIPDGFRRLFADYHRIAGRYAADARRRLAAVAPVLAPQYRVSLELVYSLYHQVYEKMCPHGGRFHSADLRPSEDEVRERIQSVLSALQDPCKVSTRPE